MNEQQKDAIRFIKRAIKANLLISAITVMTSILFFYLAPNLKVDFWLVFPLIIFSVIMTTECLIWIFRTELIKAGINPETLKYKEDRKE